MGLPAPASPPGYMMLYRRVAIYTVSSLGSIVRKNPRQHDFYCKQPIGTSGWVPGNHGGDRGVNSDDREAV